MAPHAVGDDEVVGIRPFAVVGDVPMKEAAVRVEVQHVETVPMEVEQKEEEEEEEHKKPSRNWIMGEEAFERRMPHHDGIRALWETKWKFPCTMSVYPFHDGKFEDFEPVFQHLIENNVNDGTSPAYTKAFLPAAEALALRADSLLAAAAAHGRGADADADSKAQASALYLRACSLYRIARFPYITSSPAVNDPVKWHAWQLQKAAYAKAGKLWDEPLQEVHVPHRPHRHRRANDGGAAAAASSSSIPVYVRVPRAAEDGAHPCPLVILMTGLDGYRPDNTARCDEFLARGWACCVAEVPGTADCPADPADPAAAERLWDDLLAWAGAVGVFDMARVMVWGLSSGGYYAVRIAHTHASRLAGVVAQGAGAHLFFDPGWLARADGHEYPFLLTPALAMKHGYGSVEEYVAGAQKKFSLLENGILDMPSTRLLLVNGTMDGLMPIEDSMLLFEHGSPKEARFFSGALHMGYPKANGSVYPWMESVMASVV